MFGPKMLVGYCLISHMIFLRFWKLFEFLFEHDRNMFIKNEQWNVTKEKLVAYFLYITTTIQFFLYNKPISLRFA